MYDIHFVPKVLLKLIRTIKTCLIRLKIILYYPQPFNTDEYFICNLLKNHTHFHLKILL